MSKTLIYLVAIFCLWMYFKFSSSANGKTLAEKYNVKDFDKARSGSGGTMVAFVPGGGFYSPETVKMSSGIKGKF